MVNVISRWISFSHAVGLQVHSGLWIQSKICTITCIFTISPPPPLPYPKINSPYLHHHHHNNTITIVTYSRLLLFTLLLCLTNIDLLCLLKPYSQSIYKASYWYQFHAFQWHCNIVTKPNGTNETIRVYCMVVYVEMWR